MPFPHPAFLPPAPRSLHISQRPFSSAFLCARPVCPRRPPSRPRFEASVNPFGARPFFHRRGPSESLNSGDSAPETPAWDGVRQVLRVSALSAAMLLAGITGPPRGVTRGLMRAPNSVAAQLASTTVKDTSGTGDVEAAAMTLGAVTVGGLVMRAIVSSRRDEEEERRRLAAECNRLEEEEKERALRAKRRKMEAVEGGVMGDEDLMTDFMRRVQSLERGDDEDDDDETFGNDASMRHTPIPDRGTGSAVLDRPDEAVSTDESTPVESSENDTGDNAGNPEELEMLNRMWNLSTEGDGKGDKGKGKGTRN